MLLLPLASLSSLASASDDAVALDLTSSLMALRRIHQSLLFTRRTASCATLASAVLFGLGLFTVMTRKNSVGILLGVELILNAAALNFVAFNHFVAGGISGAGASSMSF